MARSRPRLTLLPDTGNQKRDLARLVKLAYDAHTSPVVWETARQITADCDARDEQCEIQAVYDAVKYGNANAPALANGLRYVSDSQIFDTFVSPSRMLDMCTRGACAGDCDDHSAMVAALLMSIGYQTGLKVWGPGTDPDAPFSHVYPLVAYPKRNPKGYLALDTTVDSADVGWEPKGAGHHYTKWIK